MSERAERGYPWVVAVVITLGYGLVVGDAPMSTRLGRLMEPAITIAAIAIGFLATAESILFSIQDTRIARQLVEIKYFEKLVRYLTQAVNWCFLWVFLSASGLLVDVDVYQRWHTYAFMVWLFVTAMAMTMCHRITRILAALLRAKG